jgi:hypothetical protein
VSRRSAEIAPLNARAAVADFDYAAPAEMFMARAKLARRSPIAYRRFETAAEAIRFAIEQVQTSLLVGAIMEVEEQRYDHRGIRELYDRDAYPFVRH